MARDHAPALEYGIFSNSPILVDSHIFWSLHSRNSVRKRIDFMPDIDSLVVRHLHER